jgi:hypothetical protein
LTREISLWERTSNALNSDNVTSVDVHVAKGIESCNPGTEEGGSFCRVQLFRNRDDGFGM